ncbi:MULTISPECIES: hypothetical protein [Curtobacterium]|uniref:hypothetical protein n=1 Tax=Curtobacterium flaccumfaciens TaxID=2035 RepID=UPI0031036FF8
MSDTSNSHPEDLTNDEDGTPKTGGLGDDGTIPNHPEGVAAGLSETDSHFNPEEDPEHD